ncbi:hypothetical protein GCM10028773_14390 [Spirosoma koreense]
MAYLSSKYKPIQPGSTVGYKKYPYFVAFVTRSGTEVRLKVDRLADQDTWRALGILSVYS